MSGDFIRYYISDIHLSMLETIQRESGKFNEWELIDGSKFEYKHSYGYTENLIRDESLLEAVLKHSVIAETRQLASVKPSILWEGASNIADILTLLSLARARYYSVVIENNRGQTHGISWRGYLITEELEGNRDIVPISNLGRFIAEALTYIENNRSWLKESGFDPSVYWLWQAQKSCFTAPSILELALYWVSLEVLSRAYIVTQGIKEKRKKELVKRFINDRGYTGSTWDFLEKAIDDWYIARNDAFHEGKERLPIELLTKRGKQIRDFTSLVFVEMLQKQEDARKNGIAMRMQNY